MNKQTYVITLEDGRTFKVAGDFLYHAVSEFHRDPAAYGATTKPEDHLIVDVHVEDYQAPVTSVTLFADSSDMVTVNKLTGEVVFTPISSSITIEPSSEDLAKFSAATDSTLLTKLKEELKVITLTDVLAVLAAIFLTSLLFIYKLPQYGNP